MEKISIIKVSEKLFIHPGFRDKGCYSSGCRDACCRRGCDVDRESYDMIMEHRENIEGLLGRSIDRCFDREWSGQEDFLGHNSIASTIINGTCPFHTPSGKGCVLWQMVFRNNVPLRIVPSTCRLYPVTWNKGVLDIVDCIEKECSCLDPFNSVTLWDSQKDAINDIFQLNIEP
ncbi:MAG: hypothetical protein SCH71_14980 [Desulfobulbaceae bacterium]|nr:hypothetical protein [Desulfobulbaceae bacterium]